MKQFWKINLFAALVVACSFAAAVSHGFAQADMKAFSPTERHAAAK